MGCPCFLCSTFIGGNSGRVILATTLLLGAWLLYSLPLCLLLFLLLLLLLL
jgi:hypothetical protein